MVQEFKQYWSSSMAFENRHLFAENLAHFYMDIKKLLIEIGYESEIDWQENLKEERVDETNFIRELAWVIISSGMRESVVRKKFPELSNVFYDWESAEIICSNSDSCFDKAISIFNNVRKINAILKSCEILVQKGLFRILHELYEIGPNSLEIFPFIGPVTCFHLAKNLGVSTAKPDRHLSRIASLAGYFDPNEFCNDLSDITGDDVSVIDIVFWRYASLNTNYIQNIQSVIH